MQIPLYTRNTKPINFQKNTKSYDLGYQHGKQDGLVGCGINMQKRKFFVDKMEYEEGYNKGYNVGKKKREPAIVTRTDIIQYFVVKGMPRVEAKKIVAKHSRIGIL